MKHFSLAENIAVRMKEVESELGISHEEQDIDCRLIDTWEYCPLHIIDKQKVALLEESFQDVGQLQPITLVNTNELIATNTNPAAQYIIVDGHKRFLVCQKHNHPIQAVIKNLTQEQMLDFLFLEIVDKKFSDYAKCVMFHKILKDKLLTPQALCKKAKITLKRLNQLLIYCKIPDALTEAIGDLSHVSTKTASALIAISKLGDPYLKALIGISDKIAHGFAIKRIQQLLTNILGQPIPIGEDEVHKFKYHGQVLMEWRKNIITLNKELCQNEHYEDLMQRFEEAIKKFEDNDL